jgi:HNH endonuclease
MIEDPDLIITISAEWRQAIGERDGWVCGICQDPSRPVDQHRRWPDALAAVVDHIVPEKLGGINNLGNLQIAHNRCNGLKGQRLTIARQYAQAVLSLAVEGKPVPARLWQRYGDCPQRGSITWRCRHDWLARRCDSGKVAIEPWRLILRYQVSRARRHRARRSEMLRTGQP